MTAENVGQDLIQCYRDSPQPSYKVSNYFKIYEELFGHLRGTECTFIEIGVLNGGSLFMWKNWLGEKARIIGVDLNPAAKKWEAAGFEIHIGDQGSTEFWVEFFGKIGHFDALLDDGGHQSFQQIVTLEAALAAARRKCVIVIEDTCANFLAEFSGHGQHSFLEYAKASSDVLLAKTSTFFPGQFPAIQSSSAVEKLASVQSISFYSGMVAYKVDPIAVDCPYLLWNKEPDAAAATDFRYAGATSATIEWPDMFSRKTVTVKGGRLGDA